MIDLQESPKVAKTRFNMLTAYQIELFKEIATGISVRAIAQRLNRNQASLNSAIWRAKEKIGASNNAHAVYLLTKQGVI